MNTVLFQVGTWSVTISVLMSVVVALLLCLAACWWLKHTAARILAVILIVSTWWSALNLTGQATVGLDLQNTDTMPILTLGPLTIGGTVFYSWIVMAVLTVSSWLVTRRLKTTLNVSATQTALEMIVMTIRSQIKEVSGDNPARYLPMMGTFFLFIGLSNLLTVLPWFRTPTASLSTTLAFALCVFCAMPIYGIKNAGVMGYLKKYVDPTPIMLPLNILSDFSSTFSLAFRLYGNMLSGVIITSVLMMLAPILVPLPLQVLGLITGTIQAYIFALLAIVYVSSVGPQQQYVDHLNYD